MRYAVGRWSFCNNVRLAYFYMEVLFSVANSMMWILVMRAYKHHKKDNYCTIIPNEVWRICHCKPNVPRERVVFMNILHFLEQMYSDKMCKGGLYYAYLSNPYSHWWELLKEHLCYWFRRPFGNCLERMFFWYQDIARSQNWVY